MLNKMSVFVQVFFQKEKFEAQRQTCLISSDERKAVRQGTAEPTFKVASSQVDSGRSPELSFSLSVRQGTAEPTLKVALPEGGFFRRRNKKIILSGLSAFLFLFTFSIFPQENTDQKSDDSPTATAAQPQVQTTSVRPPRFDPKTPQLTMKAIKKLMEVDIQEKLLEKKLPEELSKVKARSELVTNISFQFLMAEYDRLVKNPELPEVTRIHPNWYKAYGEKLAKFKPAVSAVMRAVDSRSSNNYFLAVRDFKKLQEECLAFLKEPMPKITKEQYASLHKANTKQRAIDYEKYMKERRAAEIREAQEKKAKAAKKAAQ